MAESLITAIIERRPGYKITTTDLLARHQLRAYQLAS